MKQFSFRSGHPGSVIEPVPGKLQLHDVLAQKSFCLPHIISSLTVLSCNMNYLINMKATFLRNCTCLSASHRQNPGCKIYSHQAIGQDFFLHTGHVIIQDYSIY